MLPQNVARNSRMTISNIEFGSLEFQRFPAVCGLALGGIRREIGGGVLQEAADGVVAPSQAKEMQASACGSGVAVSKQLMGAAVSGLVAGACFSVVNRLFNRR